MCSSQFASTKILLNPIEKAKVDTTETVFLMLKKIQGPITLLYVSVSLNETEANDPAKLSAFL
jgi:hypothetical protein